jgi:hypothetical protein
VADSYAQSLSLDLQLGQVVPTKQVDEILYLPDLFGGQQRFLAWLTKRVRRKASMRFLF